MWTVHLALFLVSLFYAILFSWAGQIMPTYMSADALTLLRIGFAFVLFQLFSRILNLEKIDWKKHGKELAICGFLGTSGNMYLFFLGLEITSPINASVLMLFTPLFVGIFDHVRLKQKPHIAFIVGVIMAFFGCLYLIDNKSSIQYQSWKGDILVAINAIFYALYLTRVKKLTSIYKPITINRGTFTFGLIYMIPIGLKDILNTNWQNIPISISYKILYLLIFTSFLVYLLNAYAVKKAGPSLAGIYIYLQPVLATVIAVILKTDTLDYTTAVILFLVLISTFTATRYTPKQSKSLLQD